VTSTRLALVAVLACLALGLAVAALVLAVAAGP
jgi:hypothetical protein